MGSNDGAIDRGIAALNRAAGAVLSIPEVVHQVELTSNAMHLVPPTNGSAAFLSKTPQVVTGGRRWRQLQALQAKRAADTASIRATWKGAIAGQIFAGIRERFAQAGLEAPKLGSVKAT